MGDHPIKHFYSLCGFFFSTYLNQIHLRGIENNGIFGIGTELNGWTRTMISANGKDGWRGHGLDVDDSRRGIRKSVARFVRATRPEHETLGPDRQRMASLT